MIEILYNTVLCILFYSLFYCGMLLYHITSCRVRLNSILLHYKRLIMIRIYIQNCVRLYSIVFEYNALTYVANQIKLNYITSYHKL